MQYDNEKTIVLFKNDYKKSETQPDFKGELTVNGETFTVAVWAKTSKNGRDMLRGKLEAKQEFVEPPAEFNYTPKTLVQKRGGDSEDIPF